MRTASRQALPPVRRLSLALLACSLAPASHAAFVVDSSASLTTSNIYLNRDFREGAGQNKREEWGLSFLTRYVHGDNATVTGSTEEGREWERDIELKYVVQNGPLKDLYVRLRNASFRSSFARDADENRMIVGYSLPIW